MNAARGKPGANFILTGKKLQASHSSQEQNRDAIYPHFFLIQYTKHKLG